MFSKTHGDSKFFSKHNQSSFMSRDDKKQDNQSLDDSFDEIMSLGDNDINAVGAGGT
jgi:hypothetical protein